MAPGCETLARVDTHAGPPRLLVLLGAFGGPGPAFPIPAPGAPGFPPYARGARLPRTAAGRRWWRTLEPALGGGLRQGREQLNGTRERLGLRPLRCEHGGISRQLCLVATLPQLEYPRAWPEWTRVVGPLMWEPPADEAEP